MYENSTGKKFNTSEIPKKERTCTDIACAILFILCTLGGIIAAIYGIKTGDLSKMAQPYDQDGNACGRGKAKDFPLLFYNSPKPQNLSKENICIKDCPKNEESKIECLPNSIYDQ